MNALALHHGTGESELKRYGVAACAILALHLLGVLAAISWFARPAPEGVSLPAIMIDMAPAPAAEKIQPQEIAPGPEMQESDAAAEPPKTPELIEEQLPPTPVQPEPVVATPPKVEKKPQPVREPPKPKPVQKQVRKEAKKESKTPPAPRTTAPPKAERVGRESPSPSSGASAAAAMASYRSILSAHLQRYKRHPGGSGSGTTALSFTVTRNGGVTSARLARSSGNPALDQETLALIQRARPLPAFPSEIRQGSMSFVVPFNFTR